MVWTIWKCLFKLPSWPKLFSQMLHLCGWIFSWTHSRCLFRLLCWKDEYSHKSHLYFFLFSWIIWKCLLRFPSRPKLFLQMLHWCGLLFSWTHSMCFLKLPCSKAENSHKSHLNFLLFSWTIWICVLRFPFSPKHFSQMLHWCCFRFSWTHSMWSLRPLCWKEEKSHKSHLYFFLFLWTIWTWFSRVPFRPKLFWQMLHWCCLRFSCTHSMWSLRPLCAKEEKSHKSHWYFFLFSWTVWKCHLRFDLMLKLFWQMWHRCSLSFSWTHLMRTLSLIVEFSHKSHWKGLPLSWRALMCFWRVDLSPKNILQIWQFKESSFRWNLFVWYFRSCLTPNDLLQ